MNLLLNSYLFILLKHTTERMKSIMLDYDDTNSLSEYINKLILYFDCLLSFFKFKTKLFLLLLTVSIALSESICYNFNNSKLNLLNKVFIVSIGKVINIEPQKYL